MTPLSTSSSPTPKTLRSRSLGPGRWEAAPLGIGRLGVVREARPHHRRASGPRRRSPRSRHGAFGVPHRWDQRPNCRARPDGSGRGDVPVPIPEITRPADTKKKYVRDIARVCQELHDIVLASFDAGALPLVLGGERGVGVPHRVAAARPDLDGSPRRHEHAADNIERQRARDTARRAPRTRARGARIDRILAVGAPTQHGARGRPQPRRTGIRIGFTGRAYTVLK